MDRFESSRLASQRKVESPADIQRKSWGQEKAKGKHYLDILGKARCSGLLHEAWWQRVREDGEEGSEERVVGPGTNHEEPHRLYSGVLSFFLRALGSHGRILRKREHYWISIPEPLFWLSVEDGQRRKRGHCRRIIWAQHSPAKY